MKNALIGTQLSIIGTAIVAISSHPGTSSNVGAVGILVLVIGTVAFTRGIRE